MEKQVTSTPQYLEMGGGGSGYLDLHYLPLVDREPAINVDMVNIREKNIIYLSFLSIDTGPPNFEYYARSAKFLILRGKHF